LPTMGSCLWLAVDKLWLAGTTISGK
jgi:hypothetical protein